MTLLDIANPFFALVDPAAKGGPRPLLYTMHTDPNGSLRRYAEAEGICGASAPDRGRELAYARGLEIWTWTREDLVSAARGAVAVHAPSDS